MNAQPLALFPEPMPFLKWAGGKRQLLPKILPLVPPLVGRYFEPFVGAGALFFALKPRRAVLADANARLIRTYRGIQQAPHDVIELARNLPNEKSFFLEQRARDIDACSDSELAAWMLYLNRTGYNGLYRVNKQGKFNVPFGRYENPRICDPENLRACSAALSGAELRVCDFEEAVADARKGDFVYFDPPYVPISKYSDFSRYTAKGFTGTDQVRLRNLARSLKARGVNVLLSNSDSPEIRSLYDDFTLTSVNASRMINSRPEGRAGVLELLIT